MKPPLFPGDGFFLIAVAIIDHNLSFSIRNMPGGLTRVPPY